MDKFDALEQIKNTWNDQDISLGERILDISTLFHSSGLNIDTTAAYIKATPAEVDAFLALGELDEELIEKISLVNPPKTTWMMFANASAEEISMALNALGTKGAKAIESTGFSTFSEYVYSKMVEISGPTAEQRVGGLSGDDLKHALKKGEDFNALTDWETKFLKSVTAQKKRGKVLSEKQVIQVKKILTALADKGAIKRNSIDGDQDICDRILDALGK